MGVISAVNESTFGARMSISSSRTVYTRLIKINYSVCFHADDGKCHQVQQCDSLMSLKIVLGQQWSSAAQKKKIYQALDPHLLTTREIWNIIRPICEHLLIKDLPSEMS